MFGIGEIIEILIQIAFLLEDSITEWCVADGTPLFGKVSAENKIQLCGFIAQLYVHMHKLKG